jgi:micrococcal nuclease
MRKLQAVVAADVRRVASAIALVLLLAAPAMARSFEGVVSHVTDGDSLWVRPDGGGAPVQVRVLGIDAPEICQSWGAQSRDALAARVLHRRVRVDTDANDSFERALAQVSLDGQDIGQWMVGNGHAWSYRFRRDSGPYAAQEAQARSGQLGLWALGQPQEPRDFRKQHSSCR